jgi:hypothetical protein
MRKPYFADEVPDGNVEQPIADEGDEAGEPV